MPPVVPAPPPGSRGLQPASMPGGQYNAMGSAGRGRPPPSHLRGLFTAQATGTPGLRPFEPYHRGHRAPPGGDRL